ncbi:helix-turn-helix domain-containing protein [Pontibacter chitinilyticus]|uniref:helix-turn-helix domain-containing protein n=1 Tax=Pontibacter chitinilyticus TaxID=2674989 RepID=UPI00321A33FB
MNERLYFLISILCALQGTLLSLIFFRKGRNHPASQMLGVYLFIFSVGMLENFLTENVTGSTGKLLFSFLGFSNFLYGPLLYLFVYFLTVQQPVFKARQTLHFIPFATFFLADTILVLVSGQSLRKDFPVFELVLFEVLVIQLLTYNVLAFRKLYHHRLAILQIHSSLEAKDLRWLMFLVTLLTGIYFLSFGITHLVIFGMEGAGEYYILVQALITVSVYLMSYRVLFQPALFILPRSASALEALPESIAGLPAAKGTEKYQRSGLKSSQAETYASLLQKYMETEKPYLDPELTIHALAEKLSISRNHLTEVINETLGQNFYEFVNAYRVEEVKRLLADARFAHLNLAALGNEAGFKSKTAFNSNFKKFTGVTPSKWKASSNHSSEIRLKEVLS